MDCNHRRLSVHRRRRRLLSVTKRRSLCKQFHVSNMWKLHWFLGCLSSRFWNITCTFLLFQSVCIPESLHKKASPYSRAVTSWNGSVRKPSREIARRWPWSGNLFLGTQINSTCFGKRKISLLFNQPRHWAFGPILRTRWTLNWPRPPVLIPKSVWWPSCFNSAPLRGQRTFVVFSHPKVHYYRATVPFHGRTQDPTSQPSVEVDQLPLERINVKQWCRDMVDRVLVNYCLTRRRLKDWRANNLLSCNIRQQQTICVCIYLSVCVFIWGNFRYFSFG